MNELPIRFVTSQLNKDLIPLQLYTVGSNIQNALHRPKGFSATQVLITLSGSGRIRINGQHDRVAAKKHAFIIYEGIPHEYFPISDEPWLVGFISIRGTCVPTMLDNMELKNGEVLPINELELLWKLAEQIWTLAEHNRPELIWKLSELLYSFLLEFRKQTLFFPTHTPKVDHSNPSEAVLEHVTTILKEHYTQPISLSEVSKASGYSHQHLNRLFRQYYGVTLNQYLQNLRILHAVDLIERNKHITLNEIADELGIDTRYFTRLFKKNMGMSPGEYKRKAHC
ncbi:AraC family transcriptional regulator [Metabacillus sp. Hm71]|uniref:AraC family transcriptional regulator n=1 Tax=Metabacillus sp. Hm71 TaxID=3450743 RepID=UPI003F41E175